VGALRHDVRYALRALRSSPGFAAVAIITIALAVGSNTALFSFVNGMVLNPLPYADADRIVRVLERRPDGGLNAVSTLNYLDWKEQGTVFEVISPRTGWQATWTGGDEPVQRGDPARLGAVGDHAVLRGRHAEHVDALALRHVEPLVGVEAAAKK